MERENYNGMTIICQGDESNDGRIARCYCWVFQGESAVTSMDNALFGVLVEVSKDTAQNVLEGTDAAGLVAEEARKWTRQLLDGGASSPKRLHRRVLRRDEDTGGLVVDETEEDM